MKQEKNQVRKGFDLSRRGFIGKVGAVSAAFAVAPHTILDAKSTGEFMQQPENIKSPEILPDRKAIFRLFAPNAKSVTIGGDYPVGDSRNGHEKELTKDNNGVWSITLGPVPVDFYGYYYLVDGRRTLDPNNVFVNRDGSRYLNVLRISGPELSDYEVNDVPHGNLIISWYPSSILKGNRRIFIYTPPGYETGNQRYPVFYLQHRVLEAQRFRDRAMDLLTSPSAARAFDLGQEPASLRDRFGRTPFGQGLLLARRLVEAGVELVTVNWSRDYHASDNDLWDTHAGHFGKVKRNLAPALDAAFSTLLIDLDRRGLLDDTLVVLMGEFGRTPKVNANGGRDHWAPCNTVVLAGGGIRGGAVYGASDRIAAWPSERPVGPEDIAATLYHALGVPPETHLHDRAGRPVNLCSGRPLVDLFA